ncbi:unnamed protein product [Aphanomyces euteiches]
MAQRVQQAMDKRCNITWPVQATADLKGFLKCLSVVQSPIDAALSREEIKQQKERMSAHHASKMKEMNEGLAEERDQIVERSMRRMRERRKKLQQQTQTYLEEAASHVQSRHAEHASWRKAKLEGSSSA